MSVLGDRGACVLTCSSLDFPTSVGFDSAAPARAEFQQLRNEVGNVVVMQEATDAKIRQLSVAANQISDRVDTLVE